MVDDTTRRHLARQRVRGAPATQPGLRGFVRDYDVDELLRQTQRSLVCPLSPGAFTIDAIREAFVKLRAVADAQGLQTTGAPLVVVKSDPASDVPHKRELEACLPVRGEAKEEGDVQPSRLEGGYYVVSTTADGLDDVENLYTWLFGKFLPARKHELTRPYILHRIVTGLIEGEPVSVEVQVPATLSIKPVPVAGSNAG